MKASLEEKLRPKPTLVALGLEASNICQAILRNEGELTGELEALFDQNSRALAAKVDSYVFIEGQLEMNAGFYKAKADAFKEIADRFTKAREKLRDRVKFVMRELQREELTGKLHRFLLVGMKPKLVITDENLIPPECKMVVTEMVPDKEKIRGLLEDGFPVPGAVLEPVNALRIGEISEED